MEIWFGGFSLGMREGGLRVLDFFRIYSGKKLHSEIAYTIQMLGQGPEQGLGGLGFKVGFRIPTSAK